MTTPETAELIKYASNAFLATKISFINEVARLCEASGTNIEDVARGIGLDDRIGKKFLNAGPGYGGSCFPKDARAFAKSARDFGTPLSIIEAVIAVNRKTQEYMVDRITAACGGTLHGKTIGVLGLAYKANTDDVRDAPALKIIPLLLQAGAHIRAFDPIAMKKASEKLQDIIYAKTAYDAACDADAVVIMTEWDEFRTLDMQHMASAMKVPRLIDLRNIYSLEDMVKQPFHYTSIGRPDINPQSGGQ